jgi:hypothetical protein
MIELNKSSSEKELFHPFINPPSHTCTVMFAVSCETKIMQEFAELKYLVKTREFRKNNIRVFLLLIDCFSWKGCSVP